MVSKKYQAYLQTNRGQTSLNAKEKHLQRALNNSKTNFTKKHIKKKIEELQTLKNKTSPIIPKSYIVDGKKVSKAQYEQSIKDKSKNLKKNEQLIAKTTRYERQYQQKQSIKGVDVTKEPERTWQETQDFNQKQETWEDYYDRKYKLKTKPTQTLKSIKNTKGKIIGYEDSFNKISVLIPKGKEVTDLNLLKENKKRAVNKEILEKSKQKEKIFNLTGSVTGYKKQGSLFFYPGYFKDYQAFANKKIYTSNSILTKSLYGASKVAVGVMEPILDTPYYTIKLIDSESKIIQSIGPVLSDLKDNIINKSFNISTQNSFDFSLFKPATKIIKNQISTVTNKGIFLASGALKNVQTSFREDPLYSGSVAVGLFAGDKIIGSVSDVVPKINVKVQSKLDKLLPSRPYYVEKLPDGFEIHKGKFVQHILRYKGQSLERGGKIFGVRRVQAFKSDKILKNPLKQTTAFIDKVKGRKPGQIKYFDTIGQDILLRNTPSEFATPKTELLIPNKGTQTVASVTPDSNFLIKGVKDGGYTSISAGGQELKTIQGRYGVGGGELGQFFSSPTTKDIAGIKKGTPQVYTFYSGVTGSKDYVNKLPIKFVLKKPKPGIIFQQENIVAPVTIKKSYEELAQDLAGYTAPGTFQVSASTIKGVRTELEVIKSPQTLTTLSQTTNINVPGYTKGFNVFYGRNVPLTKKGYQEALESNIKFLEKRINEVKGLVEITPELKSKGDIIIKRELQNIENIKLAQQGKQLKNIPILDSKSKEAYSKFNDLGLSHSSLPNYNYINPTDLISSSKPYISGVKSIVNSINSKLSSSSNIKSSSSFNEFIPNSSNSVIISSNSINSKSSSSSNIKSSSSFNEFIPNSSNSVITSSNSINSKSNNSQNSYISFIKTQESNSIYLSSLIRKSKKTPFYNYGVEVRNKGKFKSLFGRFRTKSEAQNYGMFKVGTTARASFRIVTKNTGKKRRFLGKGIATDFYKKGNIFIERRNRRIKSSGEVREISLKGQYVKKIKNKFKMW